MATYLSLFHFTPQGAQNFRTSPSRANAFKSVAGKVGVTVKQVYWTLGDYDGVLIFEAADDETATASMLSLASLGNIRTKTLRAFTASEMETIIGKAPGVAK